MTLAETRARLARDRERLESCLAERAIATRCVGCLPAWTSVVLYRYSHWLFARGWRVASRLLWQLNLWITGADISPMADLGPGLVILHPFAVTITGNAGRDFFVEGWGGLGGGMAMDDVGAGPGVPILGDGVRLDRGAMVLGPVRIGHRVRIGPGCTVVRDVEDDHDVAPLPVRVRHGAAT